MANYGIWYLIRDILALFGALTLVLIFATGIRYAEDSLWCNGLYLGNGRWAYQEGSWVTSNDSYRPKEGEICQLRPPLNETP